MAATAFVPLWAVFVEPGALVPAASKPFVPPLFVPAIPASISDTRLVFPDLDFLRGVPAISLVTGFAVDSALVSAVAELVWVAVFVWPVTSARVFEPAAIWFVDGALVELAVGLFVAPFFGDSFATAPFFPFSAFALDPGELVPALESPFTAGPFVPPSF